MKCNNCNSCVRLIRVPNTLENSVGDIKAWFCDVCGNSFMMGSNIIVNKDTSLYEDIKKKYYELYKGATI